MGTLIVLAGVGDAEEGIEDAPAWFGTVQDKWIHARVWALHFGALGFATLGRIGGVPVVWLAQYCRHLLRGV